MYPSLPWINNDPCILCYPSRDNGFINHVHIIDSHYLKACKFNGFFGFVRSSRMANLRMSGSNLSRVRNVRQRSKISGWTRVAKLWLSSRLSNRDKSELMHYFYFPKKFELRGKSIWADNVICDDRVLPESLGLTILTERLSIVYGFCLSAALYVWTKVTTHDFLCNSTRKPDS